MRACLRRPPGVEGLTLPHALSKTRGPGLVCARSYARRKWINFEKCEKIRIAPSRENAVSGLSVLTTPPEQ